MANILTASTLVTMFFLFILFIGGLKFVGNEVFERNSNLDSTSLSIISDINYSANNNYNDESLEVSASSLTANSTFEGVDPFTRQYLEDKSEAQQQQTIWNRILTAPDFLWKMIGIESPIIITTFSGILYAYLVIMIALALVMLIKGET